MDIATSSTATLSQRISRILSCPSFREMLYSTSRGLRASRCNWSTEIGSAVPSGRLGAAGLFFMSVGSGEFLWVGSLCAMGTRSPGLPTRVDFYIEVGYRRHAVSLGKNPRELPPSQKPNYRGF